MNPSKNSPQSEERREVCRICGRDNPVWFAPNEIWNVIDQTGILCPICFIREAEKAGLDPTGWELRPEPSIPTETREPEIREVDPCPFCGEEPEETHANDSSYFYVGCGNENCAVQPETGLQTSAKLARDAWNWGWSSPSRPTEIREQDALREAQSAATAYALKLGAAETRVEVLEKALRELRDFMWSEGYADQTALMAKVDELLERKG